MANEPSAEFAAMVEANKWHDREELQGVIDTLLSLSVDGDFSKHWSKRDWHCKYVGLVIDMRDGGFVIQDRDGKRISLEQVKWQRPRDVTSDVISVKEK